MMHSKIDAQGMAAVRRAYAIQVLALAHVENNESLEDALATVERENFVPPPPWTYNRPGGHQQVAKTDDVSFLYQDILVSLQKEKGVNNGSPTFHAFAIDRLKVKEGYHIAHIGAGSGYYSAVLSHLVGPTGRVTAVEYDDALFTLLQRNLKNFENVNVIQGDGADWPSNPVDSIYVNFAVVRPSLRWIEHLKHGGRLLFPLAAARERGDEPSGSRTAFGGTLLVTKCEDILQAQYLGPSLFVAAQGGRLSGSADERAALLTAFQNGGIERVTALTLSTDERHQYWHAGAGWGLLM